MPEQPPPPTGPKAQFNKIKKNISTLRTAVHHRDTISDGIQLVKKTKKITKKIQDDIGRARHEIVRAVSNYISLLLSLLTFVAEKIGVFFVTAIAAEDDDDYNEYEYLYFAR